MVKMLKLNRFLLLAAIVLCSIASLQGVSITTNQGTLKGVELKSRNGTAFYAFYGIPFAKPPVGELRFQSPQEPDPWTGIRNATVPPPKCIQGEDSPKKGSTVKVYGQEDCLFLNVFTSAINTPSSSASLPVIVQIPGGAFTTGNSADLDPIYFMDYPLVVVTIQYRLSILGFLSAGDETLPGNYGLKDQVAALKWVKKNIKAFGGNPNSVTLAGESAGGTSTSLHMYSPLSKGLFHRAISQSGSALLPWAHTSTQLARARASAVGVLTGCSTKKSRTLVDCLKELPAETFIEVHDKLYVWDVHPNILFPPVLERETVADAFLTKNPWTANVVNEVPWLAGINSAEGGVIGARYFGGAESVAKALVSELNKNYKRLFPLVLYYGFWVENKNVTHISEGLKQFYFPDGEISTKNSKKFIDLFSDACFTFGTIETARRYKGTLYFYYYDHRNVRSHNEIFGNYKKEDLGVCHCDDLISLFNLPYFSKVTDGPDFTVSKRMVEYWINFVYNGNPNGKGNTWQPVKSKAFEYLHITTSKDTMENNLLKERYDLWMNLVGDSSKA